MCLFCNDICDVCRHHYTCTQCLREYGTELDTIDGSHVCERCKSLYYEECADCGKLVYTDGYSSKDGDWVCADCADYDCDHCGCKGPICKFDGNDVCSQCLQDNYYICDQCGCYVHTDHVRGDDFTFLCSFCYDEHYTNCSDCDALINLDDTHYSNDEPYCSDCYSELEDAVYGRPGCPVIGKTFRKIRSPRRYGVEIETCYSLPKYAEHDWGIESEHCGVEYVSPILQGDEGLEFIETLYADVEPEVDDDCGLHVHVDIRDLDDKQRLHLIKVLRANKQQFLDRTDYSRHNAFYCKGDIPAVGPYDTFETYMRELSTDRYCWVNLNAIHKHGTIEFRLHEATDDYDEVERWVTFVVNFVEKAFAEIVAGEREVSFRDKDRIERMVAAACG